MKLEVGLVLVYGLIAAIFYGWMRYSPKKSSLLIAFSGQESASPFLGVSTATTSLMVPSNNPSCISESFQILYFLNGALYVWMSLIFCLQLVLTMAISNEKREDRKIRFYFFSVPALLAILAVLIGIFSGTIGPFGRDSTFSRFT